MAFQLTSCGRTSAGAAEPTPPDVEVVTVEQKDIPVYREWIGTLDGQFNAAIRSQVTGYLLTQDYSEGSFVKKGQLLFQIDPRPLPVQAARTTERHSTLQSAGRGMAELMLVESPGNSGTGAPGCKSHMGFQRPDSIDAGMHQSRRITYAR